MSYGLVALAVIWYAGLLLVLAAIMLLLRAVFRVPIVRKVVSSIQIDDDAP